MKTLVGVTALTRVMAAVAMACNSTDGWPSRSPAPDSTPESVPTTSTGPSVDVPDHSTTVAPPNGTTRIRVTIGEERFEMTLDGSAASQDLIAQLPVTLQMRDHGGVERPDVRRSPSLSMASPPVRTQTSRTLATTLRAPTSSSTTATSRTTQASLFSVA